MDQMLLAFGSDPGLSVTWIIGGMAIAITALAGALAAVAGKLYLDLKESRKDIVACHAARVEETQVHARELYVLKSMILGRRKT